MHRCAIWGIGAIASPLSLNMQPLSSCMCTRVLGTARAAPGGGGGAEKIREIQSSILGLQTTVKIFNYL